MGAYFCAFVAVIGNVLCMDWFFQAIEEMKWITLFNVVPKLVLTPLIFVFVRTPSDYWLLLLIQAGMFVSSGLAGSALACRRLGRALPLPKLHAIVDQLRDGWRTFVATVCSNVYTGSNTVILGLLTDVSVVGHYSAGQKVVAGIQSLWNPVSQSLYPHFCKSFQSTPERAAHDLKRLLWAVPAVTIAGAILTCILAPRLVPLYLGSRFAGSVRIIQILIFSVAAVATNTILGLHGMVASGMHSSFLRIVAGAALLNLVLAPSAIFVGGHEGLAVAAVAIETMIGVAEYFILRRRAIL